MATGVMAGPKEEKFRSDCRVHCTLKDSGGIAITVKSKVEILYGNSIREYTRKVVDALDVTHADVIVEDSGAVPFALAARIETAIKRAKPDCTAEFLPEWIVREPAPPSKESFRRTRLYIPGNQPHVLMNGGLYKADGVTFDLEDSVAVSEKDAARIMVRNALRSVEMGDAERMVRINPFPLGEEDLKAIIPQQPHVILVPKVETPQEIHDIEAAIDKILKEKKLHFTVLLIPVIETARGVLNAYQIATASPMVAALTMGLEDYSADIGVERTTEGVESLWARGFVLNAAKAVGVQALDTVYGDVDDADGLLKSTLEAKALGFEGKGCIHPRQIEIVHKGFTPTEKEIDKAKRIVKAYEEAEAQGIGVVALEGRMIDMPVVKRASKTVKLATMFGCLHQNWREEQ